MSDVKHAFRLMIIDIEADKVIVDEFCDAIVAGTATKSDDGEGPGTHNVLSASKCDLHIGVAAVMAAEEAIEKTKKNTVEAVLKRAAGGDIGDMIKKFFEEDDDGC